MSNREATVHRFILIWEDVLEELELGGLRRGDEVAKERVAILLEEAVHVITDVTVGVSKGVTTQSHKW